MAADAILKNEFNEDEKYHNLMSFSQFILHAAFGYSESSEISDFNVHLCSYHQ